MLRLEKYQAYNSRARVFDRSERQRHRPQRFASRLALRDRRCIDPVSLARSVPPKALKQIRNPRFHHVKMAHHHVAVGHSASNARRSILDHVNCRIRDATCKSASRVKKQFHEFARRVSYFRMATPKVGALRLAREHRVAWNVRCCVNGTPAETCRKLE